MCMNAPHDVFGAFLLLNLYLLTDLKYKCTVLHVVFNVSVVRYHSKSILILV